MKKSFGMVMTFALILIWGCAPNEDFDMISNTCEENIGANATFAQVKALYEEELLQIQQDWIIEGYVVSSDKAGNFFSVLHFQDRPSNPTEGFQLEIDLFESHLLFEPGQKMMIKTKGLYLGKSRDVFKLGGTFSGFGNTTVGRLPALQLPQHVFRACDGFVSIEPQKIDIAALNNNMTNTLVQFEGVQFLEDDFGKPYAISREETERILEDCNGHQITLLNSGFADFHSEILPQENGIITGVVLRENDNFFLAIRDLTDVNFQSERCPDLRQSSTQLLFSELADPNNNSSARFLELYNSSDAAINLKGWIIRRYTNESTEVSSVIDLTGFMVAARSTFVISPNATEFENIYGFFPDLEVGINAPADSNGDDNLELVDPFGTVVDVFGVPGEDGTGTNHEFEDGRAVRDPSISKANATYTFSEWTVYNDSGGAGTSNRPQNAPEDFTPGIRE